MEKRKEVVSKAKSFLEKVFNLAQEQGYDAPLVKEIRYWLNNWERLLSEYLSFGATLKKEEIFLDWLEKDIANYEKTLTQRDDILSLLDAAWGVMDALINFIEDFREVRKK